MTTMKEKIYPASTHKEEPETLKDKAHEKYEGAKEKVKEMTGKKEEPEPTMSEKLTEKMHETKDSLAKTTGLKKEEASPPTMA